MSVAAVQVCVFAVHYWAACAMRSAVSVEIFKSIFIKLAGMLRGEGWEGR